MRSEDVLVRIVHQPYAPGRDLFEQNQLQRRYQRANLMKFERQRCLQRTNKIP